MRNIFLIQVIFLFSFISVLGQNINKVRNNIIGSWKFNKLVNPELPDENKICYDTTFIFRAYTFNSEGKVTIWPVDIKVFEFKNQILTYGIYEKDINNKKYTILKMVTNDYQPQDYKAIDNGAGITYLITFSSDTELRLIKYYKGSVINLNSWQYQFKKVQNP